jgi:uncharacterized membrane protein YfcA
MTTLLLVSFCVVVFAAAAQAVTGFGFALVAVPLLALMLDPRTAVVAVTGIGFALSTLAMSRERAHVQWRPAGVVSLAGLLGIPGGLYVLSVVDERILNAVIAVVVLTFAVLLAFRLRLSPGMRVEVVAGVASGTLLAATGMNGPPLVAAFQSMGLAPREFRATLQAAFTAQAALAVTGLLLTGQFSRASIVVVLVAIPGLVVGWLVGDKLSRRLRVRHYQKVILTTLGFSGSAALLRALVG